MKKGIWFSFIGLLFAVVLWCNPLKVNAEGYYWAAVQETAEDGSMVSVSSWYKGGHPNAAYSEKIDGMPELVSGDEIYIHTLVTDEVSEWLKNLSGNLMTVALYCDTEVQVGNPDSAEALQVHYVRADSGTLTYYGNATQMEMDGSQNEVHFIGDIELLELGDLNSYLKCGSIDVTGNVAEVVWYPPNDSENYDGGFQGTVTVSGTVTGGGIYDFVYNDVLETEVWQVVKNIGTCENGTFVMTDGVLAEQVPVTDAEVEEITYRFVYQCYSWGWSKQIQNADTREVLAMVNCTTEDVPEGAEVTLYSTSKTEPVVLNVDVGYLYVWSNEGLDTTASMVINGDVDRVSVGEGYQNSGYNVTINGDVEDLHISHRYQPNKDLKISGTVADGDAYEDSAFIGYFSCSNTQIIEDGNWNLDLFFSPSRNNSTQIGFQQVAKEDVTDALAGENVGEKVTISTDSGDVTLVKDASVEISQTSSYDYIFSVNTEDVQKVLEEMAEEAKNAVVEALTAIDINISTLYRDTESGAVYDGSEDYGKKEVTQLSEGKSLSFTIKVPADYYKENATYSVVRYHENEDGTTFADVLETRQEGDELTFSSDKFSTFIVVQTLSTEDVPQVKVEVTYTYVKEDGDNALYVDTVYVPEGTTWGEFFQNYAKCYDNGVITDAADDIEAWEVHVQNVQYSDVTTCYGDVVKNFNDYTDCALVSLMGLPPTYKHGYVAFEYIEDGDCKDSGTGWDMLLPTEYAYGSQEAIAYVAENLSMHTYIQEYCNIPGAVVTITAPYEPAEGKWDGYVVRIEVKSSTANVMAFVTRMYTVALGRDPEEGGAEYWARQLLAYEIDGAGIASGFITSPEFVSRNYSHAEYIAVLYSTFFDREADEEGLQYWEGKIAEGYSREYMLAGFVNSDEFFSLCANFGISKGYMNEDGTVVNEGIYRFAERLYTKVLERSGEKDGIEYWVKRIANKEDTPETAAQGFFESDEYCSKNTTDEKYVKTLYVTFLDREAEQEGLNYWLNLLSSGTSREQALKEFAQSDEFKGIVAEYGL